MLEACEGMFNARDVSQEGCRLDSLSSNRFLRVCVLLCAFVTSSNGREVSVVFQGEILPGDPTKTSPELTPPLFCQDG